MKIQVGQYVEITHIESNYETKERTIIDKFICRVKGTVTDITNAYISIDIDMSEFSFHDYGNITIPWSSIEYAAVAAPED